MGYDVVAYQTLAKGVPDVQGSPKFAAFLPTSTGNYTFWFANQANMQLFDKDPWKYAPKYGGF